MQVGDEPGLGHLAWHVVAHDLGQPSCDSEQPRQVDPVSKPIACSMWMASSLQMLPVAPGAYGQPPRPPSEPSKRAMPSCTEASTLAAHAQFGEAPGPAQHLVGRHIALHRAAETG